MLWRELFLPSSPPPATSNTPVYAGLRPLVGGPSFLPLHIEVAVGDTVYDFLPAEPTAMATTAALVTGQSVDGRIRLRSLKAPPAIPSPRWQLIAHTMKTSDELQSFAQEQPAALSLLSNNCFTFAARLVSFAEEP